MRIDIIDLGMNGEGVGKIDGKVTLVDYTLPSESADVEIVKDYKNYMLARASEILSTSNKRVNPPCKYFYICGGCNLQHMCYPLQLEFKTELIRKTIKKIAGIDCFVENTVACNNQYNYRNKASFNYRGMHAGFYKTNSHEIVDIDECKICTQAINEVFAIFNQYIKQNNLESFIKHLVVRELNSQILIGVVTNKHININSLYNILLDNSNLGILQTKKFGLYQIVNTRRDSVVLKGKVYFVAGIKDIEIYNFGLTYFVDLIGFHQTNIDIQNKIYQCVLEYISPNEIVVNGFSGAGLLSGIISSKAKHVYGIEIDKSSHLSAQKLKKDNKIENLTNILCDFNKEIEKITKYDTLVLDPSKKGLGKSILEKITRAKKIIYISCNPIALAKDLNYLKDYFNIEKIIPFDMFPNTKVVETVVILKNKERL